MNPQAVQSALELSAKVIWMPTVDAANEYHLRGKSGGISIYNENDSLLSALHSMTTGISLGLAIGMSLGVLFGIVTDNIGLGMMVGTAIGLCGGSAADALKVKKKETSDGEKKSDEK